MVRFAGAAAVALGAVYLLVGVVYFLLPADQQAGGTGPLLASLADDGTARYLTFQWLFVLSGVLGFSVVGGLAPVFAGARAGLVHLASALGYLGFAAVIIDSFTSISQVYAGLPDAFVQADERLQSVLGGDVASSGLDPDGWVAFGAVGLWLLGLSVLALADATLPRGAATLGLVAAIGYVLVPVGSAADVEVLITIAAALAIVVAPAFYLWTGLTMRRATAAPAG